MRIRARRRTGLLLALLFWAAPALGQTDFELVCPCTVETVNLTSVDVTFGVRSLLTDDDTGRLRAILEGRREGGDGNWQRLGTVHLPAVAAGATVESRTYRVAFRQRLAGTWELRLRVFADGFRARDSIHWLAEPVENVIGGGSLSSVYFDGRPTVSVTGGNATVELPAIRNPRGGTKANRLTLELAGADGLDLDLDAGAIATHAFNADLAPDAEIAAAEITLALNSTGSHDYLQLRIIDGNRKVLAYETVDVPAGEPMPVRAIATADADILVDSDDDGVSDVNERLMHTDPDDAGSRPGKSTIDVLALYSAGFDEAYDGEPSTRIRHVITLADTIFGDSGVDAALRLVGIAEIALDESRAFTEADPDVTSELIDLHGADVAVLFRPWVETSGTCGWAYIGGLLTSGTGVYDFNEQRVVHVFGDCGASTTAHEIGHLMGLGHSYAQNSVGAFRWSRGHGVSDQFVTVMAYASAFGFPTEIDKFSDPDGDCNGSPCGVAAEEPDGADAVRTLNATRFQVANFAAAKPDSDKDGFVDPVDAFPRDPDEQFDFDGDGTGDNADTDDDNDGVADTGDIFPYDATEWADTDGDGTGDNADAFPDDRFEVLDTDGDGVGDNSDRFPGDPTETVDTDNDGVGNNADAFPFDTRDWLDTDGDGTGDNRDTDDDGDGVADTHDHFPLDAARTSVSSYRFVVTEGSSRSRRIAPAGDIDGDGKGDFLVGLVDYRRNGNGWSSAVYLIASADLAAADAADGETDRSIRLDSIHDQPGSWRFVGEGSDDMAGYSVSGAGDIDGDGRDEVMIGAPSNDASDGMSGAGAAYLISPGGLAAADAADGETDGEVGLGNIAGQENSWKIIGEAMGDYAGISTGLAGDLDGDGKSELAVGARWQGSGNGAVYILSPARLSAADEADGTGDGHISLGRVAALAGSWKLNGQASNNQVGEVAPAQAQDQEGNAALLLTATGHRNSEGDTVGAVYLLSSADLASVDSADGAGDGVIDLGRAAAAANSWQFVGKADSRLRGAAGLDDIDGDDIADVFLESGDRAFFISGADLAALDEADQTDGVIRAHGLDTDRSWEAPGFAPEGSPAVRGNLNGDDTPDLAVLSGKIAWLVSGADLSAAGERAGKGFSAIPSRANSWQVQARVGARHRVLEVGLTGDVNGDSVDDTLMFAGNDAFLLVSADLGVLDDGDTVNDGRIDLFQLAGDTDGDGIEDVVDGDDDNDGYGDSGDRFPRDAAEWADRDSDGVGDNSDAFPMDEDEQRDTDGDGTGDNADTDDDGDGVADDSDPHPLDTDDDGTDNALDDDDDGDGVADTNDAFPLDSGESLDTDGDGTGDNADTDDDGDGTADLADALPLDPRETADTDGDGVGDNADAFPNDAGESADADGDGTGDNADTDDDNDGVADVDDAFPYDGAESADSDGDGVGDNADAFPNDAAEWTDTDGDGTGDNADTDDDGDDYTDGADAFPLDSGRTRLFNYRLTGENARAYAGLAVAAGDLDGDGTAEALIGAPGTTPDFRTFLYFSYGASYALSAGDFDNADATDDLADRVIELDNVAAQTASKAISGESAGDEAGESLAILGDLGVDGTAEWLLGAPNADNVGAAYLISPADLDAADAANGADGTAGVQDIVTQSGSWMFEGEDFLDQAGRSVAAAGDVNGDGNTDLLIGAPYHGEKLQGAAYLVSGTGFGFADSADGFSDGRIELGGIAGRNGSWKFLGEPGEGLAGRHVSPAGDIDGDGMDDILIAAPHHSENGLRSRGALYLIASADLTAADEADDTSEAAATPESDGEISLANVAAQSASWKIVGEADRNYAGRAAMTADLDGDGKLELIVGAPGHQSGDGAVYILPIAGLEAADEADGTSDRVVDLGEVAALPDGYRFTGDDASSGLFGPGSGAGGALSAADLDGDGRAELLVGAEDYQEGGAWCPAPGEQRQSGAVYVISSLDFAAADEADGVADGAARLVNVAGRPNSWQLLGEPTDRLGASISAEADLDGDGRADLVMGGPEQFHRHGACGLSRGEGIAVILSGKDIAEADRRDGAEDGVVDFESLRRLERAADFDLDGTENRLDSDDDNDGVADAEDAFPLDPGETADNDHDGIGDNADPDDDNEGTPDRLDAFPFDPYETDDTDGDGTGNNADTDDDGDGTLDVDDAFPLDASETVDSDGDGVGDNADDDPDSADRDTDGDGTADSEDSDDDGDGVADADDLYPLDSARSDLFYYRIAGTAIGLATTDYDGDGRDDLVLKSARGVTYLASAADLDDTDSADGSADRLVDFDRDSVPANSWKLNANRHDRIFGAGDVDSDGKDDLVVHDLVVSASSLAAEDDAYGTAGDRLMRLSATSAGRDDGIWRLRGSRLDWGVFSLADLDADGRDDLLVGAPLRVGEFEPFIDAVYVASGADLQSADTLDGSEDGNIRLDVLRRRSGFWRIESETDIAMGASIGPAGDVNGDGQLDLLIGAPDMPFGTNPDSGGIIILSGASMSSLDAADGYTDGEITITPGRQEGAWKLGGKDFERGEAASAAGDTDGDGLDDILLKAASGVYLVTGATIATPGGGSAATGTRRFAWMDYGLGLGDVDGDALDDFLLVDYGSAYLVSGRDLHGLGDEYGAVYLDADSVPKYSWRLAFRDTDIEFNDTASMADLDGDGKPELVLPVTVYGEEETEDATFLVSTAELALLDRQDGKGDGVIHLDRLANRWD